jgi:hypothetical protein
LSQSGIGFRNVHSVKGPHGRFNAERRNCGRERGLQAAETQFRPPASSKFGAPLCASTRCGLNAVLPYFLNPRTKRSMRSRPFSMFAMLVA